jgi:3-phenylpropionate/cinnamic acid dioxygenase small subunit
MTPEERIKRLEDTEDIRRLLLEYGRTLDDRDFAAYSGLFSDDGGEWAGGFGSFKGPAEIKAAMERTIGTAPNTQGNYHLLSNFIVDVDGDTAKAWSRWSFVVPGETGDPRLMVSGRYDDELVRENGRWKFQRRTVSGDIGGAPPTANR